MYVAGIVRQPAFVTVSPNDRTLCGTADTAPGASARGEAFLLQGAR
jgi:hypothetical protein